MCDQPITRDDVTFACRTCDACIAARRSGWVARAMAERTQWKHSVCVSLTYDDKAPGGYDAARFFAYHDVRAFVQRITAALRRIDKTLCVRFLCAGEQGSRNDRCHWHLILWSNHDLRTLGTVTIRGNEITDPEKMMSVGKRKRRLHWSLWAREGFPLGFVTFGAADEAGAAYVVSYCLKDQFTIEKSEGKAREAKAEDFATGLFRMSKRPAIGEAWLMQKLQDLDDLASVLPHTQIKVPGLGGYYYPSGTMREKLLWGLRAINQRRVWADRGIAPQWSGLLEACKDNPADMEILNGPEENDEADIGEDIRRKARWLAGEQQRRKEAVFRRDYEAICEPCLEHRGEGIQSYRTDRFEGWAFRVRETGAPAFGKAFVLENRGAPCPCEVCGEKREVWAVRRQSEA